MRFSSGPGFKLWTLTPETRLEAQTQYTMTTLLGDIHFTTGTGEDLVAPEAPVLKAATHASVIGGCGQEWWDLSLEGGSDDATPRDELLLFVQTSASDELADASYVTTMNSPLLSALCGFTPPRGDSFPVTIQVMDRAGNLSPLSNMKRAPACSVSLSGTLIILSLALLRRPRSRGERSSRSEG